MNVHTLAPNADTVHTFFDPTLAALLTIDPGDAVRFELLESGGRLQRPQHPGGPAPRLVPARPGPDAHALCGPVAIRGARPGMALAIRVERLRVGSWGQTFIDGTFARGARHVHLWDLDADAGSGRNQLGHTVLLRPFLGVMGVAPAAPGPHSTVPPRIYGGNIDCRELTAGSRLFLPVAVDGALFSAGDGHALQGDGEVSGTAIECPMAEALLSFELAPDPPLATPWAETTAGDWLTFGFDSDLEQACHAAVEAMLVLMAARLRLARNDAIALASLLVNLRITQIVNGTQGVHALLAAGDIARLQASV